MSKPRPEKTLADYVAVAISPVLIMLLVGTLCFFLAEVLARQAATGTFRWILFWYVVAIVLISRIGIEQGKAYAAGYGAALAGAVSLVAIKLLSSAVGLTVIVLLGIVWWAANKLVWDCTLIDEKQDASGEGLLRASGLESESRGEDASAKPQAVEGDDVAKQTEREARNPFWQRWFQRFADAPLEEQPDTKPHAPGIWVVYFSLAALPLFGLGQLMIPDENSRRYAFNLLWLYVAAGLALLMTTSFLGLRRYLRQRKLNMPGSVTRAWLTTGGGLILAIMLLCLLLPRPQAAYSLTHVVDRISTKIGKASHNALVKGEAGEGDGNRIGKRDDKKFDRGKGGDKGPDNEAGEGGGKKKPGGKGDGKGKKGSGKKRGKGQGGKNGKQNDDRNKQNAQRGKNEQNPDNRRGGQKQEDDEDKDEQQGGGRGGGDSKRQQNSNQPGSTSAGGWIGSTLKWIIYILLAVAILFIVIRYREQIIEGLRRFFVDLRNLFARKPKTVVATAGVAGDVATPKPQPRPFSEFANPFETGSADQMETETVIAYTFEAMESWAYEQNIEHKPEQTPMEFAREVGEESPGMADDSVRLARLYTRAAYSDAPPPDNCRDDLREAWYQMNSSPPPGVANDVNRREYRHE